MSDNYFLMANLRTAADPVRQIFLLLLIWSVCSTTRQAFRWAAKRENAGAFFYWRKVGLFGIWLVLIPLLIAWKESDSGELEQIPGLPLFGREAIIVHGLTMILASFLCVFVGSLIGGLIGLCSRKRPLPEVPQS